jgi:flagellar hook-associated protein 1 FlgK
VPSGFVATDPHGFAAGQTSELVLRDATGRALTRFTLSPVAGGTFGDLVGQLNASPLASFGTFALDPRGRIQFQSDPGVSGAAISITSDSTDRSGTGLSFSALSALTGKAAGLARAHVRSEILGDTTRLPLARLQLDVPVGGKAIGPGDIRGANAFVQQLGKPVDLGKDGVSTLDRFSGLLLGRAGTEAAQASEAYQDATARRTDAVNRRDSFAGVNIDEELAQMVVLQNSYSAAARVMTTASQMYDTLIDMIR